jgi:hypothetical protein
MAPEEQVNNGSTDETSGQEQQDQQQQGTPEAGANGEQQQVKIDDSTQLPETHPLVKTLAKQKADLATAKQALAEANANSSKATKLEQELNERPTKEAMETLQTRYDRLEAFLIAAGGPLGKALDSRTFTKDLFESDKDVAALVKEWHRANPSATSEALGSKGSDTTGKPNINDALRAAAGH